MPKVWLDERVSLAERLQQRIADEGPLRFDEWMDACLYDPEDGYYMQPRRKTGAGSDADFATSAVLHPFMAECIAREIHTAWQTAGEPAEFQVAEFGGGEGDLARDALAWLANTQLQPDWLHVEISPDHREKQAGQQITTLPEEFVGAIVAHEFVDALPFRVLRRTEAGWDELYANPAPVWQAATDLPDVPYVRPETQVEVMVRAKHWLEALPAGAGPAIVVDYGRDGPSHDSLRTFRAHQDGGSPFEEPGQKDITANVDFRQLSAWAEAAGFKPSQSESQEAFLLRHGALDALNAIDKDSVEGASAFLRLRQLVLPTAMGHAFRVAIFER